HVDRKEGIEGWPGLSHQMALKTIAGTPYRPAWWMPLWDSSRFSRMLPFLTERQKHVFYLAVQQPVVVLPPGAYGQDGSRGHTLLPELAPEHERQRARDEHRSTGQNNAQQQQGRHRLCMGRT